jgi:hypothetical protein
MTEGSSYTEDNDISWLELKWWHSELQRCLINLDPGHIAFDDFEVSFLATMQMPIVVVLTDIETLLNAGASERLEDEQGAINAGAAH